MHISHRVDMRFPAPTCNAEASSVETSAASENPPWSPLQNSWVTNNGDNFTCYEQVRHFFQANFTSIWGNLF